MKKWDFLIVRKKNGQNFKEVNIMKFSEYIGSQLSNPHGFIGKICCLAMNTLNSMMYKNIIADVKADKTSHILDIGCGNGFLIHKLYQKNKSHLYGIDISEDMIRTTAKRNKKAVESGTVKISVGNCCNLPFKNSTFDTVTTINTIYFWVDTLKGLSEIKRVLKDDGVFYNAVYSNEWLEKSSYTRTNFKLFEKSDYIKLGKKAGFSSVAIKEIVSGKSYIIRYTK